MSICLDVPTSVTTIEGKIMNMNNIKIYYNESRDEMPYTILFTDRVKGYKGLRRCDAICLNDPMQLKSYNVHWYELEKENEGN